MKRKILSLLFIVAIISANAQEIETTPKLPEIYLGVGTGINNYTGLLGVSGNLRIVKTTFLQVGLGLGSWGYKYSVGFRHDLNYDRGWSFGVGVSNCTGLKNFEMEMEHYDGDTKPVKLNLKKANTLNLKATHNWMIGRKNTFYVDLGYAVPLQQSPWEITDGSRISDTSRQALDISAPGGIILGLGFTFGL